MQCLENASTEFELLDIMSTIEGPFAFVYYKAETNKIYFARDCLGRRSLLWNKSDKGPFMLSSVGKAAEETEKVDDIWKEVPANGIYCIDLDATEKQEVVACGMPMRLYPWTYGNIQDRIENLKQGKLVCGSLMLQDISIHCILIDISVPQTQQHCT